MREGARGRASAAWVAVLACAAVLVLPLPGFVIDALLLAQLAAAVLGIARRPQTHGERALGPRIILAGALSRVVVAVALLRAATGSGDAGFLITLAGTIAQAGGVLGGVGAFVALTTLHVMVVARGAERLGQVTARFALDALPGRQLALEGELRQRLADSARVGVERARLLRDAETAGHVDGVTRMLRAESVALAALVALVFVGALLGGVYERGIEAAEAARAALGTALGASLWLQVPALAAAGAAAWLALQSGSDAPTRDDDEEAPWALSTRRADATAAQQALSRALVPAGLSLPVLRSTFDETLPTGTLKLKRRGVVILSGTIGGGLEPLARRRLAPLLVTLQATAARLSALESSAPVLIRAAMPSRVDVVQLTRVLRALAADALPSHDLETVLDALTAAPPGADIEACVGAARRAFTDALTARLLGCAPERVACAGATLESALARGAPAPSLVGDLVERIDALPGEPMTLVCVLCSPEARVPLADLFATTRPQVAVIALDEVRPGTRIIPAAIL